MCYIASGFSCCVYLVAVLMRVCTQPGNPRLFAVSMRVCCRCVVVVVPGQSTVTYVGQWSFCMVQAGVSATI